MSAPHKPDSLLETYWPWLVIAYGFLFVMILANFKPVQ
jgi:hypothetical protein